MKSKYFHIHELVPPKIYKKYGDKAWRFIDSKIIQAIDKLKEVFNEGTMTINNYYWNGDRQWSGLRTPDSPYYSPTSLHSMGRAIDAVFSKYDPEEVRQYIKGNIKQFDGIRGIEENISWVHIDTRNEDNVVLFDPHGKLGEIII